MAKAFMCLDEEKLALDNKLPSFYKRCVDDTLALVCNLSIANRSIQFAMEVAYNDQLAFIGSG